MGFRHEPHAELKCVESATPDPRHGGINFVERTFVLVISDDLEIVLAPGIGEAVKAIQAQRPQLVAEVEGRYWWMYGDRIFSTAERLGRGAVARLADGREGEIETRWSRLPDALAIWPPAGLMAWFSDLAPLIPG